MADATFRSGSPEYVDYTPSGGNVAAGEVVLLGNTAGLACGIAPVAITNNTLGSLAVMGGVWDVVMLPNVAAYSYVYWDNTNNKVTNTSTNMAPFGYLIEGGTGANTTVACLFHPHGV